MVCFLQKIELVRRVDILLAGAERLSRVSAVLVEQRIDSISLNPDTIITTAMAILETEKRRSRLVAWTSRRAVIKSLLLSLAASFGRV
jgi:hypothetical protein